MPLLGADMTAGRLVQWFKQPGDPVTRGEIIADLLSKSDSMRISLSELKKMAESGESGA